MFDINKILKNEFENKEMKKFVEKKEQSKIKYKKIYSKIKKVSKSTLNRKKEYHKKYDILDKTSLIYFADAVKEIKNEVNKMYPKISKTDKEELIAALIKDYEKYI